MSENNLKKLLKITQLHVIDECYQTEFDTALKNYDPQIFNTFYSENLTENQSLEFLFDITNKGLRDILCLFDYSKCIHYPQFIELYAKSLVKCGEYACEVQSNLPYHMFCFTKAMDSMQNHILNYSQYLENNLEILRKCSLAFKHICQGYNYYQYDTPIFESNNELVLTMTSCKRLDLFIRTVQSFLICCTDHHKISKWICIDDNSSEEDRSEMQKVFPWIEYIFKTPEQKGHAKSMNILRVYVKEKYNPKYILHLEDDWKFVTKHDYISHCIDILEHNDKSEQRDDKSEQRDDKLEEQKRIGQVLFNLNYSEDENHVSNGGILRTIPSSLTQKNRLYVEHQHFTPALPEKQMSYWPHFSMRPGILRAEIWNNFEFPENSKHFEMEFAYKYISNNYITTFLPSLVCIHTGKLTSDAAGTNAYILNGQEQFSLTKTLPVQYAHIKGYSNSEYKLTLTRMKKLKDKNWFCTTRSEIEDGGNKLVNCCEHIISTRIHCLDWDFLILKTGGNSQELQLNKFDGLSNLREIQENMLGILVKHSNLDILLSMENITKLFELKESKRIFVFNIINFL